MKKLCTLALSLGLLAGTCTSAMAADMQVYYNNRAYPTKYEFQVANEVLHENQEDSEWYVERTITRNNNARTRRSREKGFKRA